MKRIRILPALLLFATASCQDAWLDHYYTESTGKSGLTLTEYIDSVPELQTFSTMLHRTGYDSLLNKPQSYTVWAFRNSPKDSSVHWNDTLSMIALLKNHIASFQYPVSQAENAPITVWNNKIQYFNKTGEAYWFGNKRLVQTDIALKNGLLHIIEEPVDFRLNIWEYLNSASEISMFQDYIASMNVRQLDQEKSFDENGVLVDSIFTTINYAKSLWGDLDLEDSIFTMIVPTNKAWVKAYNEIRPYFKTRPEDGDSITQEWNTRQAIVQDLVFSGRREVPVGYEELYSTNFNKFTHPDSIFRGLTPIEMSNGLVYVVDSIPIPSEESWNPVIKVEAENTIDQLRVTDYKDNVNLYTYSALGSQFNVSGNQFLLIQPTSTSPVASPWVRFPLPNTLSGPYKISVVFVPACIADSTDKRPYKLRFALTYYNSENKVIKNTPITVANNTTNPTTMTKLTVLERFSFPFTNLRWTDGMKLPSTENITTVILKVECLAKYAERANFSRDLRIDCILLEPVR